MLWVRIARYKYGNEHLPTGDIDLCRGYRLKEFTLEATRSRSWHPDSRSTC